jgi:hypothetical protein
MEIRGDEMTKTEKILKLCAVANAKGRETEKHLGHDGSKADLYGVRIANDTARQMVELLRMQHEALSRVGRDQYPIIEEAIEAFEKFEEGTKWG